MRLVSTPVIPPSDRTRTRLFWEQGLRVAFSTLARDSCRHTTDSAGERCKSHLESYILNSPQPAEARGLYSGEHSVTLSAHFAVLYGEKDDVRRLSIGNDGKPRCIVQHLTLKEVDTKELVRSAVNRVSFLMSAETQTHMQNHRVDV